MMPSWILEIEIWKPAHHRRPVASDRSDLNSRIRKLGLTVIVLLLTLDVIIAPVHAQSLDQRLDSETYLRGLRDLQLPEVIEHYLRIHPPADDVEAALQAITRQQALLSAATGDQRQAAVDALLTARADLIAKHPADPRRAVWLADQASDIFFEVFSIDGFGLVALFGLPDAEQSLRASAAAARMNQCAEQAEQAIDGAIRALEGLPNFSRDVMLQQRRRQLADIERDRRIPFLRGVAAYLDGERNQRDDAQQRAAWELVARTLAPLTESLEGGPLLTARLYEGLALAQLGRFDDAEKRFASVAKDPAAAPADVFAARMGGVLNRRVAKGLQSALDGLASIEEKYADPSLLFYRVLIADQQFLLRRAMAESASPADRAKFFAGAFAAYTDLAKIPYPAGTVPRDTLRSIAFSRLATAAGTTDAPVAQLPAIVAVARADALSRDPATRDQAIVALEAALKEPSLAPDDRASALFVLGRALFEADQPLLSAQRFCELARDHAADPQAERAIELAAALAWEEYSRAPDDASTRQTLRETLELLLLKYPNLASIDRWQYAAGRLALDEARYDDSMQRFAKVTANAAEWLDANFMQAVAAHEKAAGSGTGPAAQQLQQQTQQVIAKVRPEIEKGLAAVTDAARRASLLYYLAMLRVYAADATLAMGDPQKAIDALAGIESDATAGSDAIGEAMRVRINAYQAMRPPKPDEALRDLQQFVKASPQQAGAVLQPMIASLSTDVQKLIDAGQADQAKELALRTLMPAAKTLETWLQTPDAPSDPEARVSLERRVADAYRFAGDCEAATIIYARLVKLRPNASDILLGQAECFYALGGDQRLADAMGIYKRLAATGVTAGNEAYWLSQLRMLQILDATSRGTQQIVPRIERLRQSDANFGGERYRQGFEALRAKYAGK